MSTANSAASQPYIQQLRDSSYLFDQLSETQAEQLLAWAAKQLAATPEAELDETTGALSRLLRQVNGLSPMLAYLIEDELAEDLALAFVGSVAELTGHTLPDAWIDDLVNRRLDLDTDATFTHLLATLHTL
ncbi:MAG: hypothetical protein H6651_01715 [Ardenticatenales bacterium]|nr:hypothetical protein [Ardenticatenales bacterium]